MGREGGEGGLPLALSLASLHLGYYYFCNNPKSNLSPGSGGRARGERSKALELEEEEEGEEVRTGQDQSWCMGGGGGGPHQPSVLCAEQLLPGLPWDKEVVSRAGRGQTVPPCSLCSTSLEKERMGFLRRGPADGRQPRRDPGSPREEDMVPARRDGFGETGCRDGPPTLVPRDV